ncbi:D-alanyl-D-alanine carboxypeptidase family protein [Halobacillus karajensis]|uniref:serine-type D-Ala-D-Ala carboxypeptidase n=1 Tax=Halobacillus karajensis TaxID=195088 RepID=A0A024P1F9_9BACI|nr:D-alanyl-D-alanine carboxypeptidase family protein [Halobacillus karajensis]CDQ19431.1 D-alanyl-D-alanine carboxypeptidase DacF precursor [Halobacillus karajensis]CDQ21893.1 D-alanyl-D-alanine carboxypeptidase DacF precursor [Halobacillus karajensis]CDQ27734.1 D-alanyl-D-alanine carboxypeptidase DacF precursor [Halobacillus karajensis]
MKKMMGVCLALCLVFSLLPLNMTLAEEKESTEIVNSAKSAILMEKNSGMTLYNKEANKKLPPASMTKVMTLLLIMEELENGGIKLDEKVRISEHAASMGGSQIFLEAGEEMTVEDLLKGIAVASGNDASVAMAERISGSEKEFVAQMNKKAKDLGLKDTHFQNPTGLPAEDHYSTAHDMAVMARELLLHDKVTEYTKIYDDYLRKGQDNEFWLVNTNKLIKNYPGMDGLKTGYTSEAKYCLTASAQRNDMHMIAVVMGADSPKKRNADVTSLLDYGFSQYEGVKLYSKDDTMNTMKITRGKPMHLNLSPEKDVVVLKKKNDKKSDYQTEIKMAKSTDLPLKKGAHMGWVVVKNGEEEVAKVRLETSESVEKAGFPALWQRSWRNLTSFQRF